ncbi:pentapeptide repeat-containing protein [Kangiella sp. TOML190]|uniref:pentapeptide repeat-containing protein n=1 Tax=Kangiella sp. TOML190 TaxID=2931351 RepID=UPI0020411664|nr:pentapeptide repeat-containing protein [Kangiella sp. TOML190]
MNNPSKNKSAEAREQAEVKPEHSLSREALLDLLGAGSFVWNEWRHKNPKAKIVLDGEDLRGMDLSDVDLSEVSLVKANLAYSDLKNAILIATNLSQANLCYCNLNNAKLIAANLYQTNLSHANVLHANFLTAMCHQADFSNVDFKDQDLRGQNLKGANLSGADLRQQNLEGIDLRQAKLIGANLDGVNLIDANMEGANLSDVDLSSCQLTGASMHHAILNNCNLSRLDLSDFNFSGSSLRGADLRESNLSKANLDGVDLSSAKLWQIQSKGWSIRGLSCTHASWDQRGREYTHYTKNQFEKLFADKISFQLYYQRLLSYQDLATLPFLIEHLEASFWGCKLRIREVRNEPGDTQVVLVVEDTGGLNPSMLEASLQQEADKLQSIQISLQSERKLQSEIRESMQEIKDRYWPKLLELSEQDSDAKMRRMAVLFTDLKGFSNWDKQERTERLSLFRGLLKPVMKQWQASYPNMEGDSLRATFSTISQALQCAAMMQKVLTGAGFVVRIGLDVGDVKITHNEITEQLDIEGDALNFAARLESMAAPGEVLVSENVRHYALQADAPFLFKEQRLALKKSVGERQAGDMVVCFIAQPLADLK